MKIQYLDKQDTGEAVDIITVKLNECLEIDVQDYSEFHKEFKKLLEKYSK